MTALLLKFVALSLGIVAAGTLLVSSADQIGRLTKLGRSMAGFLLLAGATSLPELMIDCNAARIGAADLAVGDLLGSSIFNLLILGVIDLVHRSPVRILSSVSIAHALSATVSVVLTAIALTAILLPFQLELAGIGIGPWLIALTYVLAIRLIYFDQRIAKEGEPAQGNKDSPPGMSLRRNIAVFAFAAFTILICGPLMSRVANELAVTSGLGGTFVGTILLALTTSLPEIITTLAAVRIGAYELAAGNIFGSNCFNIAILPLVDFFYEPGSILHAVESTHAITACAIIIVTGLASMSLLYRAEKRFLLIEPDALLVVLLSLAALAGIGMLNGL